MKKFLSFMLTLLTIITFGATLNVHAATGDTYTKATAISDITDGCKIVLANSKEKKVTTSFAGSKFNGEAPVFNNGKLNGSANIKDLIVSVDPNNNSLVNIKQGDTYIKSGSSASLSSDTTEPSPKFWTLTADKDGVYLLNATTKRHIGINGNNIKCYVSSYAKAYVYIKDEIIGTKYETNFFFNDGSVRKEVISTAENANVSIPTAPVYKGHKFLGWFDSKEGGNKIVEPLTATSTSCKNFYAHWELKPSYTITLIFNDGVTPNLPYTGTEDDTIELPTNLTKDGYKFLGWYDSKVNGNKVTTISYVSDKTLYAYWEEIPSGSVFVDFAQVNANGSGYGSNKTATVGTNVFTMSIGMVTENTKITLGTNGKNNNNLTDLSSFGLTGISGATLTPEMDTNNAKSVSFTGAPVDAGKWEIYFKEVNGTPVKVANGLTSDASYTATLDTPKNGRFILVTYPNSATTKYRLEINTYSLTVEAPVVVPTFSNVQTRASLIVSYDEATRTANNVKIRFGGIVDSSLYNEANEYGILLLPGTNTDDLSSITLDQFDAYAAQGYVLNIPNSKIAQVNGGYQFAAVIKNMTGHYDFQFRAIMYMKDATSVTLAKESKNSILTVRDAYLKNANLSALYDVLNSIK